MLALLAATYRADDSDLGNLQEAERLFLNVVSKHSYRDEQDKIKLVRLFRKFDSVVEVILGTDAFETNERLQKAYGQLQKAQASLVFQQGIGRLQEVRKAIWDGLEEDKDNG